MFKLLCNSFFFIELVFDFFMDISFGLNKKKKKKKKILNKEIFSSWIKF